MRKTALLVGDFGVESREMLEQEDYRVHTVRSGREAIDLGSRISPDILVTEWALADQIHGFQVTAALRLMNPSLPVILKADVDTADLRFAAEQLGVVIWLGTPHDPASLWAALTAAMLGTGGPAAPIGVIRANRDGRIVHANPLARQLLAATRAGEGATSLRAILTPEEMTSLKSAIGEWIEVWPVAERPIAWQILSRPESDAYRMIVLPEEQCLALLDPRGSFYDYDFLVELFLDLPSRLRQHWPFKGRAIVVDESEMLRRFAAAEIEQAGVMCYSAENPAVAQLLLESDPGIEAIFGIRRPEQHSESLPVPVSQYGAGIALDRIDSIFPYLG